MRWITLVFILCNYISAVSQYNNFKVTDYTPEDYGTGIESQVLCITQGPDSNIYAGTGGVVLKFNGTNWNYYNIKEGTWITSILADVNKIYIGGNAEFGFLNKNTNGEYNYNSLSDSLAQEHIPSSSIWKIIKLQNGQILFHSENALYIYNNLELQHIIKPKTSFHQVFYVDNNLITRQRNIGLMKYSDNEFKLINRGDVFKDKGVFAIIPDKINSFYYIITNKNGIYSINKDLTNLKLINNHESILNCSIYGGRLLSDNSLMLYSNQNGLLNFNPETNKLIVINEKTGLNNIEINMITEDCYGNIWCAANNGISKLRYNLLYSIYSKEHGIKGKIRKIHIYNNHIFLGTTLGLYIYNNIENSFKIFNNINNQIWDLAVFRNELFVATNNGILKINGNKKTSYLNKGINSLSISHDKQHFIAAGNNEIYIWKNAKWNKMQLPVIGNFVNITFLNNDKGWNRFYIGTFKNGIYQLSINKNYEAEIDNFNMNDGLPNGWLIPYKMDSSLLVASQVGLFRYVSGKELQAQLPDSLKQFNIELRGYFELANIYGHIIQEPVTAFHDIEDKVWISNGYNIFYINKKNRKKVDYPFKEIKMGKLSTIYAENNKKCFVGSDYGLISVNLSKKIKEIENYSTKITTIYSINDSLFISKNIKPAILPYKNNSLKFEFTSPYYNSEKDLKYSYKLAGYNNNWSACEKNNNVNYIKLREGDYTFYVKAKNIYNQISSVDSFNFSIKPPWYRSLIAYIVYGMLAVLLIYILIQLNIRRLKIKNQKLEIIIAERTQEIREQKNKIEKQKQEITDSIHYAQRIQSAVLPSSSIIKDTVTDYFILYLPRDIVSGDFYWMGRVDNKVVILAADCTGHGVPGAFMSMLGVAFLNEIINKKKIYLPNKILDELRNHVIEALKQEGKVGEAKDGMDMSIITIDLDNNKLYYAGANNPLYFIQNGEMLQVKADKMPVAIYHKINPFQLHQFKIKKNDMIYIFSDGYQDQFGGNDGRKYMTKRFREYLSELEKYPLTEQKEKLHNEFLAWKGDRHQVDDVLVFGIKI